MIGLIFVLSWSQLAHLHFSLYSDDQSLQVNKPDVMREKEKRASLARVIQPVTVHSTRQLGCKYQGIHQNHSAFINLHCHLSSAVAELGGLEPPYHHDSNGAPYKFKEEGGKEGWEKEEEEAAPLASFLAPPLIIRTVLEACN